MYQRYSVVENINLTIKTTNNYDYYNSNNYEQEI